MSEIGSQVPDLAEKLLSSDTKVEVLSLFHGNPGLVDRTDGIALRLGRTASQLEEAVRDLVDLGVLKREKFDTGDIFYFDRAKDAEIQGILSDRIRRLSQ